ncbi:unnamed protein product, partial [Mesorhabditis spiculigera]
MPSSTRQPKKNRRLNIFNAIAGSLCCWRRDVRPMPVALEKGSEEPRRATAESWFLKLPPKDLHRDVVVKQFFNSLSGFFSRRERQCKARPEADEEKKLGLEKDSSDKEEDDEPRRRSPWADEELLEVGGLLKPSAALPVIVEDD